MLGVSVSARGGGIGTVALPGYENGDLLHDLDAGVPRLPRLLGLANGLQGGWNEIRLRKPAPNLPPQLHKSQTEPNKSASTPLGGLSNTCQITQHR